MAKQLRGADKFMAEVVNYGGYPVTRHTALKLAREAIEDEKHVQFYVFGCLKECDAEPWTYEEVKAELPE